jgi:hypothetical protein
MKPAVSAVGRLPVRAHAIRKQFETRFTAHRALDYSPPTRPMAAAEPRIKLVSSAE